jgi:hypothetical protein
MLFFFKKKKVVVRFFTTQDGLPELFPPTRLTKSMPAWWKSTPAYVDPPKNSPPEMMRRIIPIKHRKSVKHCYSIQKLFEHGWVMPMWADSIVNVLPDGSIGGAVPSGESGGEHHPVAQYPGMITADWVNWKMTSPWLIYADKPAQFMITNPFYHIQDHNWQTMPGETEFFYQHHSNINMIFRKPNGSSAFQYEFRAGDVIAYITPMFEGDVEMVAERIDPKEKERLEFGSKIWFSPATQARKNGIGGCPLHRG